jgi:hypothetical protein
MQREQQTFSGGRVHAAREAMQLLALLLRMQDHTVALVLLACVAVTAHSPCRSSVREEVAKCSSHSR